MNWRNLASEAVTDSPDARLEEESPSCSRLRSSSISHGSRLSEIERRGTYQRDGAPVGNRVARDGVSALIGGWRGAWFEPQGRSTGMPATAESVRGGEVSMSAAEVLTGAREVDRERFANAEATLVQAARIHSVPDLQRVVGYWRQACERETPLGDDDPCSSAGGSMPLARSSAWFGSTAI
jgi:hypothetical protein